MLRADGVPEYRESDKTEKIEGRWDDTGGIPITVVEPPTRKIVIGRFAFQDKCKCGASVDITPDDTREAAPMIYYDAKTFAILACPACMEV